MILFHEIEFENILSVGNTPVTIQLNQNKTTLVHGPNGSGKSTILDALCYGLFGKPFRRINMSQLINSQNGKGLLVSVRFSIGKDEYIVRRGMKPNILEVYKNDKILDANAATKDTQSNLESNILGLNFKSFTQIVILGTSSFIPFMQLPAAGRRECIEDFLDIRIFSAMSVIAKEKLRNLQNEQKTLEYDLEKEEYKRTLQQQRISEVKTLNDERIKEIESDIEECKKKICSDMIEIDSIRKRIKPLEEKVKELNTPSPVKKVEELLDVSGKLSNKIDTASKTITFYSDNDTCHTCQQYIPSELKDEYVSKSSESIREYTVARRSIDEIVKKEREKISQISEMQGLIGELQYDISRHQDRIKQQEASQQKLVGYLQHANTNETSVDYEFGILDGIKKNMDAINEKLKEATTQTVDHSIVVSLLKDSGIKAHIVKRYIPVINKFVQYYLAKLEFPIHFTLNEEFDESVHSPLYQDFSYPSFSEGQKSRIDLALLLTWREVARMKNSVSCNLLVLDEVFSSSLDETGKHCLLGILKYEIKNTNVFVVDHSLDSEFKDKFDHSIEVSMSNGFSVYN
jgi:DNA repair exonuclease SbcCD ATPase subunit